tara:strand:+ start:2436 stop:3668 length:1233 start_codon:yes stop_codon:yes gene_type:complete
MKKMLQKLKSELRPEKIIEVDEIVKKINQLLTKNKVKAECVKGGSIAKGTSLKNDYDIDLFVRFDYKYKDKEISDILEPILKQNFDVERVHGSRDYFQIHNEFLIEIVPVIKINDYKKALNVTDMSPLHVNYIKKKLRKEQMDEIRLAKQFCKAAKVYGAESYIKGFSGHILDLLIIHYDSFENLIKEAVEWNPKVIIDIEKQLENPMKELDKAKTHSPLIIVDPIQPCRNAAAALSNEKFNRFIDTCKKFLMNPNREFFKVKKLNKEKIKNKKLSNEELFFFEAESLEGKKDVVGAKIMKVYEYLKRKIKKHEFKIMKTDWEFSDKGIIYFIIKKEKLSNTEIISGPPLKEKEGVKRFKQKHKKAFIKKNRIFAEEKRKYREAEKLIKDLLKEKYVVERVKRVKRVKKS